jgi:hypothetical protein
MILSENTDDTATTARETRKRGFVTAVSRKSMRGTRFISLTGSVIALNVSRKRSIQMTAADRKKRTAAVEDALFRRAVGYSADEMVFSPEDEGERCIKIVRKEVAPSIQAQIQWLKAYKPEVWKNGSDNDPADPALLYKALTGGVSGNFEDDI